MNASTQPYNTALTDYLNLKFIEDDAVFLEALEDWWVEYGPITIRHATDLSDKENRIFIRNESFCTQQFCVEKFSELYSNEFSRGRVKRNIHNDIINLESYFETPHEYPIEDLIDEIFHTLIDHSDLVLNPTSVNGRFVYDVRLRGHRLSYPIQSYVRVYCIYEAYIDRKHKETALTRVKQCKDCGRYFASSSKGVVLCSTCSRKGERPRETK